MRARLTHAATLDADVGFGISPAMSMSVRKLVSDCSTAVTVFLFRVEGDARAERANSIRLDRC